MSGLEMIGWLVLIAGAALGVGMIVGCLYGLVAILFSYYAKKLHNATVNWQAVHAWHKSGRPTWVLGEDKVYRMVPSSGAWTYEKETE